MWSQPRRHSGRVSVLLAGLLRSAVGDVGGELVVREALGMAKGLATCLPLGPSALLGVLLSIALPPLAWPEGAPLLL